MSNSIDPRTNLLLSRLRSLDLYAPGWWEKVAETARLESLCDLEKLAAECFERSTVAVYAADLEEGTLGVYDVSRGRIDVAREILASASSDVARRVMTELIFRAFEVSVARSPEKYTDIPSSTVDYYRAELKRRGGDAAKYVVYNLIDAPPLGDPRQQHYRFAHRDLPQMLLRTKPFMDVLYPFYSGNASEFLANGWRLSGQDVPESDRIEPIGLDAKTVKLGDSGLILIAISMPQPLYPTEVWYAGFVFFGTSTHGAGESAETYDPPKRYFVVEHAVDPQSCEPYQVLAEWIDTEGSLLRKRLGTPSSMQSMDEFIGFMFKLLSSRQEG